MLPLVVVVVVVVVIASRSDLCLCVVWYFPVLYVQAIIRSGLKLVLRLHVNSVEVDLN